MRDITPQSGYTEQNLRDLLASREFVFAELFTFYTKFGDTLRYTTSDKDVIVFSPDGANPTTPQVWSSRGLKVNGLKLKIGTGVEVDDQEAVIQYTKRMKYQGAQMLDAFRLGYFDGTTVRRDRIYAKDWGQPWIASVEMFSGKLTNVNEITRSSAKVNVKSDLLLLNIQMPKNLFQPSCVHTLFDPGCTLNRDDFKVSGTTQAGTTRTKIVWSGATAGLALGRIDIEDSSGVLTIRTIRKVVGNTLYLANPLDFDPSDNMLFSAYPGCKRSLDRCKEFSNDEHFKGFPFVPLTETAM